MSKAILVLDMPETCSECYFCSKPTEFYVSGGLYTKISRCRLAPDTVEDPWRDIPWQIEHKETWCPFKPVPEKYDLDVPHDRDYDQEFEKGYNECIDEILGED